MAYTKQTWECGDTITADKLNHMEDGIEEALECCESGGGSGIEVYSLRAGSSGVRIDGLQLVTEPRPMFIENETIDMETGGINHTYFIPSFFLEDGESEYNVILTINGQTATFVWNISNSRYELME